ncbi:MAG: response regulator [Kofleriaceae bacterium]
MIEEFLRDLIRTERRSLELEDQLTHRVRRATGEFLAAVDPEPSRAPTVLLVEDDREVADRLTDELEQVGVTTFAYLSGEEAIRELRVLASQQVAIDLALVDLRLPGIDGLETIRELRTASPGLPAFLMTGYDDPGSAAVAADLGVVGYVYKPFDDLPLLIERLHELAREAMQRGREQRYLREIKDRHERVLTQYRALTPAADGG